MQNLAHAGIASPSDSCAAAVGACRDSDGSGLASDIERELGVPRLADGVDMLVEQAAEDFVSWRGVRPDNRAVIDQLTMSLV